RDAQLAAGQGDGAVGRGGKGDQVGAGVGVGGGDGGAQRAGAAVVGVGHHKDAGQGPVLQDVQAGSEGRSPGRRLPSRPLAGPAAGAARGTSTQPVQQSGKRHGSLLPRRAGLRSNGQAIGPGAQTERRGGAGPVGGLLGGKDPTGRPCSYGPRLL